MLTPAVVHSNLSTRSQSRNGPGSKISIRRPGEGGGGEGEDLHIAAEKIDASNEY